MNLVDLATRSTGEDKARELLEGIRWPQGAVCPRCEGEKARNPYKLTPKPGSKTRKGLYKCRSCRKQFTVTVGTIFEDSHIPLSKWLMAIHLMCASKKGMSAHQLHRMLGITYKSAWFLAHRIRYAMQQPPLVDKLRGIVEVDETYIGGKVSNRLGGHGGRGRGTVNKTPVVALVERKGSVRSFPVERVTGETLHTIVKGHVHPEAKLMTDNFSSYRALAAEFAHEIVNHSAGEYVRGNAHTNTVENVFSLLKRGLIGTYHHVGRRHLWRYCGEFDFRYNQRYITDGSRAALAIQQTAGKRLMYHPQLDRGIRGVVPRDYGV